MGTARRHAHARAILTTGVRRSEFLGVGFDRVDMAQALAFVVAGDATTPLRYVVTPNVDHLVRVNEIDHPQVRAAYAAADLCLCDSRIVQTLARLRGIRLATVAGSDLVEAMIPDHVRPGSRILLVGGGEDIRRRLAVKLPQVTLLHHQPPMGMLQNPAAMDGAIRFITDHPADLILLAVGSPQQEIVAYRCAMSGQATGTALCIGAGIEFLVGAKQRAPRLFRMMGMEWLIRLLSEPRRLWRRYLLHSPRIFVIFARWRPGTSATSGAGAG